MQYVPLLTTLDRVRAHRRMDAGVTTDDELLKTLIAAASAEFARETGRVCVPYYAARTFDALNPYALDLDEDLLELAALTNGDGSALAADAVTLRPLNAYPKWRIALKRSAGTVFTYSSDPAITVTGWWGYAPHYESAWRASGVSIPAMTSGTLQIGVGAAGAFEIGQYVRVEDEIMRVTGRDAESITLARAQQGTTAAAHDAGAALAIFDVLPDVQHAVTEMAVYAYKSLDRIGGRVTVYDGGAVSVDELDPLARRALNDHRRKALVVIR
jgi:hypothetical protein